MRVKELHLYLDLFSDLPETLNVTVETTEFSLNGAGYGNDDDILDKCVYTTIPRYLSFQYAKRLFVHVNGEMHEITLGNCDGTQREIKEHHLLHKMLFNNVFSWYQKE